MSAAVDPVAAGYMEQLDKLEPDELLDEARWFQIDAAYLYAHARECPLWFRAQLQASAAFSAAHARAAYEASQAIDYMEGNPS